MPFVTKLNNLNKKFALVLFVSLMINSFPQILAMYPTNCITFSVCSYKKANTFKQLTVSNCSMSISNDYIILCPTLT